MSLFFKPQPERRSISMSDWIRGIDSGGGKTKAGVTVTTSKALQVGAMWSSAHLLASTVSTFPVDVFRGSGQAKRAVSPLPTLVARPSLIVSRQDWIYQAMMSLLLRGNAIGLALEKDSLQRPVTVEWLDPDVVTIHQDSSLSRPTYSVNGTPLPVEDVLHMRAFVRPGSAIGMSPVEYHAETLGISLAARDFGSQWFGDGAHPSAILRNKAVSKIDGDVARTVKERFLGTLRGKREPVVLGQDWEYTQIQVSPNESQFIETLGYNQAEVAKIFGPGVAEILGYTQQGSSLTYSNRVDRSLDLLTYTVMFWVVKFEQLWTENIAQPQTARMNTSALLRADNKTRHEMFKIDREIGLYNVDELRALEDLPPLPDGQGQDYTPLQSGGAQNGNSGAA